MSTGKQYAPSHPARVPPLWQRPWTTDSPWPGLIILFCTVIFYIAIPHLGRGQRLHWAEVFSDVPSLRNTYFRYFTLFFGVFLASLAWQPWCRILARKLRPRWRPVHTALVLAATCTLLCVTMMHAGRHQFGGFDYSALLEVGWRQVQGQQMYTDFLTPTPPGFNLGIKYAMKLFGATWDANLYLNGIFGCTTLLWIYWLMRMLQIGRATAWIVALAIECEGVLLLSFWWYNDTTLVLSAIFLLTCLAYLEQPSSKRVGASYIASFALLAMMKPNIAGPALVGGLLLLSICLSDRRRLVLLTSCAIALVALTFAVNHISLLALVATYREVAKDRVGLSLTGLHQMDKCARGTALLACIAISLPCIPLLSHLLSRLHAGDRRSIVPLFFYPLALLLMAYGLISNGEFWQVECAPAVAVLAVFVFRSYRPSYKSWVRGVLLAVLCADIASNAYLGIVRLRVFTIGAGEFFEWTDNEHVIAAGPLEHMRVSRTMIEMQDQIGAAIKANPGPYYFGPRVDYSYFAWGIASPKYGPAWWHPGTAFGKDQQTMLIARWKGHAFNTLIFLKGEYIFYPPEFMKAINDNYRRDDSYPRLTVYRRRRPSA